MCMINNDSGSKSRDNNWVKHLDTIVNRIDEIIDKIVNKITGNIEKYNIKKLGVLTTYICKLIQKDMKNKQDKMEEERMKLLKNIVGGEEGHISQLTNHDKLKLLNDRLK